MKNLELTTLMTEEYKGDFGRVPDEWNTCYDNRGAIFQIVIYPDKRVAIEICNDKEFLKDTSKEEFNKFLVDILTKAIDKLK